jgi:hypothetical protein
MPDIYVKVKEASPQILEGLMRALELRAADPQQRAMLNAFLTDAALPKGLDCYSMSLVARKRA